ncbi:MAG TPA: translocation/assembly module TamB domain-containing protein, partial [Bacteroidales bacterium]|nr:translocation/assembly module TamB domain-containing protein [Bacteroidales bacterium]
AFSGLLKADITGTNLDSLSAAVNISQLKIYHADTLMVPDSINLALTSQGNQSAIQFHSGFMDLKYNGKGNLSKLPAEMKSYFSRYLLSAQSAYDSVDENTSFYFDAEIKKIALIREFFFPKLENLDVKLLRGRYDGSSGKFNFAMHTGNVVYDHYELDSLTFGITTDTADMRYNLKINSVQSSDIDIPVFKAEGKLYGANLFSTMQIIDRSGDPRFNLNWKLSLGDTVHELSLSPDSLIINYDHWKINKNNGISFSNVGMFFRDMVLSYRNSRISLHSEILSTNDTILHVSLKDIDLGYISQIVSRDSSIIVGRLNGSAEFQHLISGPVFSGNIQAQKLGYRGEVLGNLNLEADNKNSSNQYKVDASLVNGSSRVSLKGRYDGASTNQIDLNLEIDSFKLHSVQPYLRTYLTGVNGTLFGNLKIAGTIQDPKPSGSLRIVNSDFILATYNTHLKIAEDKINVDNKGIHLNTFSLEDNRNNKATISGSILTSDFKNFRFNVNASASNLLVLNNPKATDQQYYGKLSLSTDIRIRGNDKKPVINGSVTVLDGTNLTYSMVSQGGYVSDEGIVKFVSFAADSNRFSSVEKTISVTDSIQNRLQGMDVSANIEIQKGSKFTIILNPALNDRLDITAGAVLSFSMASSGIMNLTGKATIESGAYHMSLTRVQKQFDIQQGSSITWTGNPTEPQVNITAIYNIRTAPVGLFSANELPSDQQAKQPYRKQLPFRVELNMTGSLTDPNLKFSINMPRQYEGVLNGAVAAKLDQLKLDESEVNKQAVSLLLFGNFLSQTDQLAMLSLSNVDYANKILSEALNKTAERYIKFINLNFQLQSYNDYGQSTFTRTRTDLSVKASKDLFDNRL